jgi:hypothetical protein
MNAVEYGQSTQKLDNTKFRIISTSTKKSPTTKVVGSAAACRRATWLFRREEDLEHSQTKGGHLSQRNAWLRLHQQYTPLAGEDL